MNIFKIRASTSVVLSLVFFMGGFIGRAASCVQAGSGIIDWWPGDGNANPLVGTNNGTLVAPATATNAGFVGQAFTFDGTNGYVQIADSPILRPTNFTVECWVRFDGLDTRASGGSPAGDQYIFFKQNSRNNNFEGIFLGKTRVSGGDVFDYIVTSATGVAVEVMSTTKIVVGTWYHIAAVRGPNSIQLFVNGQMQAQATVTLPQDYGTLPLYLGTSGQNYWDHKFKGALDEVTFYNRPLATNEIAAIYTAGAAGKCKAASPPGIITQPQSITVAAGSNAPFGVVAGGSTPLSYQWWFGNSTIPGATSSTLTISNAQPANGGNYSVVVTNSAGAITSSVAVLTIITPPSFTTFPQNTTNITGTTASFIAAVSGSTPMSLQWRFNSTNLVDSARITGSLTTNLSIANVQPSDAGNYTLVASNAAGTASAVASLVVNGPPFITTQPSNQTAVAGTSTQFIVVAGGTQPLSYQWWFGSSPIGGATGSVLPFSNVQAANGGNYSAVITNVAGAITSSVAILTVVTPPSFTTFPQNTTNIAGTTASFSAAVIGSAPISLQWRFNSTNLVNSAHIAGAQTASLSITNVQPSDAGNYTLVASNVAGTASAVASLVVNGPPFITTQPSNQTAVAGTSTQLTVVAGGTQPLSYQWRFGTSPINGATASALPLNNIQDADAGSYSVVITNIAGSVTSSVVTVTVIDPVLFTLQPQNATNATGTIATFSAAATGTALITYQWRFNSNNLANSSHIAGALTPTLTISNVQSSDAGTYALIASNAAGATSSVAATLTVLFPPSITSQPTNQNVQAGSTVSFNVGASGTAPLTYSWLRNGSPVSNGGNVSGAGSSSLTLSNVQTNDSSSFQVIVTNTFGSATSSVATLTVTPQSQGTCVAPSLGIIDWWPGDGNANAIVGTNNGTLVGTARATNAGFVGQTFTFDGTNSSVQIADSPILRPTNFTVECWVRFDGLDTPALGGSAAGVQYIFFKQNSLSSNFEGIDIGKTRVSGNDLFDFIVTSSAGVSAEIMSTTKIVVGTWYHLAAVRGSNYIQIFVNGQLQAQATVTFPQNYGTLPLYFGTSGQSYWDHKFKGALDEVTFYNRPLGSNEIAAIYTAGAGGKCKAASPPGIITQPQSITVAAGSNAQFSVVAGGTVPLSYQWWFGSSTIPGASSSTLTISNAQPANGGNYSVVVTNSAGAITSSVAVLSVITPPSFTSFPQNTTNNVGTTAGFSATVGGSTPMSLQWRFNSTNLVDSVRITGSQTANLSIANVQASDAGNYTLVASNAAGTASAVASLIVNGPPFITAQPTNQSVLAGATVTFNVGASGTAPLSYSWLRNGSPLGNGGNVSGAGSSVLTLSNVQTNDSSTFRAIVTNTVGSVTSSVATLTVTSQGSCQQPPSGLSSWWTGDGNAVDLFGANNGTLVGTATATGTGMVGQAFSFDGTNSSVSIPNAPSLNLSNFTFEAWVKFNGLDTPALGNSAAGDQYIIFKQNSRSGNFEGYDIGKTRVTGGDVFKFIVTSVSGTSVEIHSTTMITVGTWYHLAAVRTTNAIQIYVNGQMQAQAAVSFPQDYGTLPLFFGTSGQNYWDHKFKGILDEVSLYNRPLAAAEILAIYNAGSGGKCKGNVAPTIIIQPVSQTLVLNGSTSFSVSAAGSQPLKYFWMKDSVGLTDNARTTGSSNSTVSIIGLQASDVGNYQAVVFNPYGAVTSAVAQLSTGFPPTNDNFSAASPISGSSGSIAGNNANATKESGEPNHAGKVGGYSVWYNWTAPSTSPVTFDTAMSAFDTLLAVYTGNSVGALTLIASNDNATTNTSRSRVTFTPVSGTVYHIAVDGNGQNGNLTLRWAQASVALPDLSVVGSAVNAHVTVETFAANSCAVVEGLIRSGTRRLLRFDTQTENSGTADLTFGDPSNNPQFVWAPCHAHYHFQNYMAYRLRYPNGTIAATGLKVGFCVLDVFRWSPSAPNQAKYTCSNQGIQVGWGDLYDNTLDGQWIDITDLPNGNYILELEPNPQGIIQESNYGNNVTQVNVTIGDPTAPPSNDNFASAQTLLGGFTSVSGSNTNATKEAGEPNHAGNIGGHSVWYQWTAVSTKVVTLDTIGSSINTLLAVYTGSTVSSLSLIASNDDIVPGANTQSQLTFNAIAGTVYRIAVDGYNGAQGNIVLTLDQTIQNDNFTGCEFVGGVGGVAHGSNLGATKESGEPDHAGNPGGASIWYCWTAPVNGTATFDTIGSTFNTLLAVYTGNTVGGLTLVAANDDIDPVGGNLQSRVSFQATGLTMYHIAIDGYNGVTGDTTLNWTLSSASQSSIVANSLLQPGVTMKSIPGAGKLTYAILPEGEFQVVINAVPMRKYRIDKSCDLIHWIPLAPTLTDSDGRAYFTDKTAMHSATISSDPICNSGQLIGVSGSKGEARFYRAIPLSGN